MYYVITDIHVMNLLTIISGAVTKSKHSLKKVTGWLNAYDNDCSPTENGLFSVGNEKKLNQKYLTSYFYIPNIIFTVLDVINSLYSWKCIRENFY